MTFQHIVAATFGVDVKSSLLFDDRFETFDEGVKRLAGIGFLGPKSIANLLLGEAMTLGQEEHLHELLLHRGEVDGLTLGSVESVVGSQYHVAYASDDVGHLTTEIVYGEERPTESQSHQQERPMLVRVAPNGER